MTVLRLLRISLTVADLPRTQAFYRDTLGFTHVSGPADLAPETLRAMGVQAAARSIVMRLGQQEIELVAFDPPGRSYPPSSTAYDPWFQHVAIVVGDMQAAWTRLQEAPIAPITTGGPQRLPPSTGSVTAFKFRDPEGHPLELIQFPPATGDPIWQQRARHALFLGIDHSAIVVRDAARSTRFYTGDLGLTEMARSVNQGSEQQRLDNAPGALVDVVALRPAREITPHVELLGYRVPPVAGQQEIAASDVAATRFVMQVTDLPSLITSLQQTTPPAPVEQADGSRLLSLRDPDGHRLHLVQEANAPQ